MVTCSRISSNSSLHSIFPICKNQSKPNFNPLPKTSIKTEHEPDPIWLKLQSEASSNSHQEPDLSNYYQTLILNHTSLESSLSHQLAIKLSLPEILPVDLLSSVFQSTFEENSDIRTAIRADLIAARDRDPASQSYVDCFLNYKGFHALQSYRAAHALWKQGRVPLALLIQGRVSAALGVDIHPGARIGKGALFDHATGVVIGETAVVGEGVTILHGVTLGGRGKDVEAGEARHPKVGDGVFVGAGAIVLGSVNVGRAAKIGAGAVVVRDVPAGATAVGNPARIVGGKLG